MFFSQTFVFQDLLLWVRWRNPPFSSPNCSRWMSWSYQSLYKRRR